VPLHLKGGLDSAATGYWADAVIPNDCVGIPYAGTESVYHSFFDSEWLFLNNICTSVSITRMQVSDSSTHKFYDALVPEESSNRDYPTSPPPKSASPRRVKFCRQLSIRMITNHLCDRLRRIPDLKRRVTCGCHLHHLHAFIRYRGRVFMLVPKSLIKAILDAPHLTRSK